MARTKIGRRTEPPTNRDKISPKTRRINQTARRIEQKKDCHQQEIRSNTKYKRERKDKTQFFHRMKPNHKKEEIFALTTNEETGEATTKPEKIRTFASGFYKNLWKDRKNTRAHSTRRMQQILTKIRNKVSSTNNTQGDLLLTRKRIHTSNKSSVKKISHQE